MTALTIILVAAAQSAHAYQVSTHAFITNAAFEKSRLNADPQLLDELGLNGASLAHPDIVVSGAAESQLAGFRKSWAYDRTGHTFR